MPSSAGKGRKPAMSCLPHKDLSSLRFSSQWENSFSPWGFTSDSANSCHGTPTPSRADSSKVALGQAGARMYQASTTKLAQLCHPQHPKHWHLLQCSSEHRSAVEACTGVDCPLPAPSRNCRREAKLIVEPHFSDAGPSRPTVAASALPTGSCHRKRSVSRFCYSTHSLWEMFVLKEDSEAPQGELFSPSYCGKPDPLWQP